MATNTSSKRPARKLRCGNIKATIWQNVREKAPLFATTFSRKTWRRSSMLPMRQRSRSPLIR